MQMKWLEDFIELSRSSTLYQAAQARHVTHPAFGRRIRALEEWAGVPLLERGQHKIKFTPAGRQLLAAATEILEILSSTHAAFHEPALRRASRITIASGRTLSHSVLPDLLTHARKQRPDFQARIITTSLSYGIDMLVEGRVDFLLCHAHSALPEKVDTRDYVFHRVGRDMLVPVSIPLHGREPRFLVPRSVSDDAVLFLNYAPSMSMGRILRSRLGGLCAPSRLEIVYESDLAESLLAMAKQGTGLAWLPYSLVQRDLSAGTLVRADTQESDIPMDIRLYRARENTKPLVRTLWAYWNPDGGECAVL